MKLHVRPMLKNLCLISKKIFKLQKTRQSLNVKSNRERLRFQPYERRVSIYGLYSYYYGLYLGHETYRR